MPIARMPCRSTGSWCRRSSAFAGQYTQDNLHQRYAAELARGLCHKPVHQYDELAFSRADRFAQDSARQRAQYDGDARPDAELFVDIPLEQPLGLYWYHTHPHGESHRQALDGMSGAIIVEGIDRYLPEIRR